MAFPRLNASGFGGSGLADFFLLLQLPWRKLPLRCGNASRRGEWFRPTPPPLNLAPVPFFAGSQHRLLGRSRLLVSVIRKHLVQRIKQSSRQCVHAVSRGMTLSPRQCRFPAWLNFLVISVLVILAGSPLTAAQLMLS